MIIVFTLGRSGSSLLMQTLNTLGVKAIGRAFDNDREVSHYEANPKGYFEEPEIMYSGPKSTTFQSLLSSHVACKMELRHLYEEDIELWINSLSEIQSIFISYRQPSEQAHSECAALKKTDNKNFFCLTMFLERYRNSFSQVAHRLEYDLSAFKSKTHLIDFSEAHKDPFQYVNFIADSAGMNPTSRQLKDAIDNIEPALYRNKLDNLQIQEKEFASKLNALEIYELLRLNNKETVWKDIIHKCQERSAV